MHRSVCRVRTQQKKMNAERPSIGEANLVGVLG